MLPDDTLLSQTLFQAIAASLSLSPESPEAQTLIYRAYGDPPPPEPPRDQDRVYYFLSTPPGVPAETELTPDRGIWQSRSFRPALLNLIFYGPGSEALAHRVMVNFLADGRGNPLSLLRGIGVRVVPEAQVPAVSWEDLKGLWRKRADLVIPLRLLHTMETAQQGALPAGTVSQPPEEEII